MIRRTRCVSQGSFRYDCIHKYHLHRYCFFRFFAVRPRSSILLPSSSRSHVSRPLPPSFRFQTSHTTET